MPIRHLDTSSGIVPEARPAVHVQTVWEWMQTAQSEQMYLLKDLFVAAGITIMSGRPKIGKKSLMMYMMNLAIASGKTIGPFIPVNPEGEHVIIFEQENTKAGNFKQWSWMAKGLGVDLASVPKLHFYYQYPGMVLESGTSIGEVLALIRAVGAKQVVFDSLRACSRGNENDSEAASLIKNNLQLVQDLGCGAMFLHHLKKGSNDKNGKPVLQDIDEELRGTGALAGMYDQHWALRETPEGGLSLQIRDKNDGDRFFSVEWFFDRRNQATTCRIQSAMDEGAISEGAAELLEILSFGEVLTLARVKEILALPGDAVRVIVDRLQADGKLILDGNEVRPV